jgi:4,5-DOPA dioxygenase extradiol
MKKTENIMPVFFLAHGDPMNAIYNNSFTESLSNMENSLKVKPEAILVISAHWLTHDTWVNTTDRPETIYDFYGFPEELYRVKYPAPGSPEYAEEVIKLIPEVKKDKSRGLDHGAWTVLKHLFPQANIPVFQLSIDFYKPLEYHIELAKKLKPLREKGVLMIGSGNIVHNVRLYFEKKDREPYDWASEFDEFVKEKIIKRDFKSLVNYEKHGKGAILSVPTTDHYIPVLYSLALADNQEEICFTFEEVWSSMSMRCFITE